MAGERERYSSAIELAKSFSRSGNWKKAAQAYYAAQKEFPSDLEALVGLGNSLYALGLYDNAIKAYLYAARTAPLSLATMEKLADAQQQTGRLEAASQTYVLIGNNLAKGNDNEAAIKAWRQAIEFFPNQINAHRNLALTFAHLGRLEQSAKEFVTLASIHQQQNDLEKARVQLEAALRIYPNNPEAAAALEALNKGSQIAPRQAAVKTAAPAPVEIGDEAADFSFFDEEVEIYEGFTPIEQACQAANEELANIMFEEMPPELSSSPSLSGQPKGHRGTASKHQLDTFISQAIDLQTRERTGEAIEAYHNIVKLGISRPAVLFNLGLLYKTKGMLPEAIEAFSLAKDDPRYDIGSRLLMAECYLTGGNVNAAFENYVDVLRNVDLQFAANTHHSALMQNYRSFISTYRQQKDVQEVHGICTAIARLFSTKDWENHLRVLRQGLDDIAEDNQATTLAELLETPEIERILQTMHSIHEHMQKNMLNTAAEECLQAIQYVPGYLLAHLRLADILFKQGRTAESLDKFIKIAEVHQTRGQPRKAISVYAQALLLAPMNTKARLLLIDELLAQSLNEEALEQYMLLADAYYQLAQIDDSLATYNKTLELADQLDVSNQWKIKILEALGNIYDQRVDWVQATWAYEMIHKLQPESQKAQLELISLYFKQGKLDSAMALFDTVSHALMAAGNLKPLIDLLQEMVQYKPEDIKLRTLLAEAFADAGMKKQAIAEYELIKERQLKIGAPRDAVRTVQKIIELGPDDLEAYQQLLKQIRSLPDS